MHHQAHGQIDVIFLGGTTSTEQHGCHTDFVGHDIGYHTSLLGGDFNQVFSLRQLLWMVHH
ncbi:hypothetical protein D3C77_665990 [compost metagenome]